MAGLDPAIHPATSIQSKKMDHRITPLRGGPVMTMETPVSPEVAFILSLVIRMAVTAAFVITASIITERSGPVIGALFATLPVSAGPSYIFLAMDHDAAFVAQAALASIPINAATIFLALVYVRVAQHAGTAVSLAAALPAWFIMAFLVRTFDWGLAAGLAINVVAYAICLPLVQRYRAVKMPLITRRWYDIPLRAALVATLVATVVTTSNIVGPTGSGIIALFPVVFTSLIIILHPRIGGPATAAVLANGLWGLVGFGLGVLVLHLGVKHFGSPVGLSLGLMTCVVWNLGLWAYGRRKRLA
jgi:hypothetical protein